VEHGIHERRPAPARRARDGRGGQPGLLVPGRGLDPEQGRMRLLRERGRMGGARLAGAARGAPPPSPLQPQRDRIRRSPKGGRGAG
jgi:hypothetical protein